jgi:hypothetical protein
MPASAPLVVSYSTGFNERRTHVESIGHTSHVGTLTGCWSCPTTGHLSCESITASTVSVLAVSCTKAASPSSARTLPMSTSCYVTVSACPRRRCVIARTCICVACMMSLPSGVSVGVYVVILQLLQHLFVSVAGRDGPLDVLIELASCHWT